MGQNVALEPLCECTTLSAPGPVAAPAAIDKRHVQVGAARVNERLDWQRIVGRFRDAGALEDDAIAGAKVARLRGRRSLCRGGPSQR